MGSSCGSPPSPSGAAALGRGTRAAGPWLRGREGAAADAGGDYGRGLDARLAGARSVSRTSSSSSGRSPPAARASLACPSSCSSTSRSGSCSSWCSSSCWCSSTAGPPLRVHGHAGWLGLRLTRRRQRDALRGLSSACAFGCVHDVVPRLMNSEIKKNIYIYIYVYICCGLLQPN